MAWTYIMTNRWRTTLYIGATENLIICEIDMSEIKKKAKAYFFSAKNMLKDKKRALFSNLHAIVKREIYRAQEVFSSLEEELKAAPWNIVRALDQVQGHGKRYLLDVAHFIRTHTIKHGKRLSHHLKEVVCISKGKPGKPFEFGRIFQIGRMAGNFVWSCILWVRMGMSWIIFNREQMSLSAWMWAGS